MRFQDSIQQQVRNHILDQAELSESQQEQVKAIEKSVDVLLADFSTAVTQISNDLRLSPEGRASDLGALRQNTTERLQRLTDSEVKAVKTRLAEMEAQLRQQPPSTDPTVQFLAERECRDLMRGRDELLLTVDYQTWAIEGAHDLEMLAIENSPAAFPLISDPSILAAGARARALRHSPEAAKALAKLRGMQAVLQNIAGQANAAIGLPDDDPTALTAAGKI